MRAIKYAIGVISVLGALWCSAIVASTKNDVSATSLDSAFAYYRSTIPTVYQQRYGETLPQLSQQALDNTVFNPVTVYYYQSLFNTDNFDLSGDRFQISWIDWESMMHVCYEKKIRSDRIRERLKYTLFDTKRFFRHVSFCQKEQFSDVIPAKPIAETLSLYQKNLPISYAREFHRQHATAGQAVEQRYGVPYSIVVAVLGMETAWGRTIGTFNAIPTLTTVSFLDPAREEYLLSLLSYLHILPIINQLNIDQTHITTFDGGMGIVQFQPNNYIPYAVDFDSASIPNIWTDMPDAIASVANFLHQHGWEKGVPWGYSVTIPEDHDELTRMANRDLSHPLTFWEKQGVAFSHALTPAESSVKATLYLPNQGSNVTQGFLLTDNFRVLMRWNPSTVEALMIGLMATQLDEQMSE